MGRERVVRYAAPAAFLAAATVAVLLVRAGLRSDAESPPTTPRVTAAITTTTLTATVPKPKPRRYYTIESGDTLGDVALKFDTSVEALLELNPSIDPAALTVGQRVRVR